jgi:hypothetical protein
LRKRRFFFCLAYTEQAEQEADKGDPRAHATPSRVKQIIATTIIYSQCPTLASAPEIAHARGALYANLSL